MSGLAAKQCVPCRGGVPPLTRAELAPLVAQLDPGWEIADYHDAKRGAILILRRTFVLADFKSAMAFAVSVGEMAEEQQHHPDLHVAWGRVTVEIWTHKIGGLTESDAIFAAKCDTLYEAR